MYLLTRFFAFCALTLSLVLFSGFDAPKPKKRVSELGNYEGYSQKRKHHKFDYRSHYVPVKDGTRLAVDVFLPKGTVKAGERVPTIVYFVRYVRSLEPRALLKAFVKPVFGHVKQKEIDFFTDHGYACMIVDLRGTGASEGFRQMEFSPQEVADMSDVLDWTVRQPWSDGQTATTGVSYTGTTAELALSTRHPSLKACIPRCNIFDLYADITFPGGVRHAPFIDVWKQTTQALDRNELHKIKPIAKTLLRGPSPVQGDKKRQNLKCALEEHEDNFDIFAGLYRVECRDDIDSLLGIPIDEFSIHNRIADIEASGVPLYRISGWYDGNCVGSTVKGYLNISNSKRLLLGPWDHGPHEHISPFVKSNKYDFAMYEEMLRFFDYYMRGIDNGIMNEPPVHYYQMGTERFVASEVWPPRGFDTETFYLNPGNRLGSQAPAAGQPEKTDYACDYTVGSGGKARWNSLTPLYRHGDTEYDNRTEMNRRMLVFDAPPAAGNMEITGHPLVELHIAADAPDVVVFAYLEEVAPDGKVTYITEGLLRAGYSKESEKPDYQWFGPYHGYRRADLQPLTPGQAVRLRFDMIPTSYLLRQGHRLRLSIATSDVDHFDVGDMRPKTLSVFHSASYPSSLQVPMKPAEGAVYGSK